MIPLHYTPRPPRPDDGNPEYAATILRGDALADSDPSKAASLYERAFEMNPGYPEPLIRKTRLLARSNEERLVKEAQDDSDRLVELFGDDAESHVTRGHIRERMNMYSDADGDYRTALELDPDSAEAYRGRGFSLAALGEHEEAAGMYREAVRLRPGDPDSVARLCSELEELGMYREALDALLGYLPLDEGRNYGIYRHIGRVYGLLGDRGRSFANYVQSVRLNPPGADATPYAMRRYEEITDIREGLEGLDPSDPESFYAGGLALLWANWTGTGCDMLATGALLRPQAWAWGRLADERARYMDYTKAIECYRRALDLAREAAGPHDSAAVLRSYQNRWYARLIERLFNVGRFRDVLEVGREAAALNMDHYNIEKYYNAVLEQMGSEPVDYDQVGGGWTARHDV